jgi:hypothetical protein
MNNDYVYKSRCLSSTFVTGVCVAVHSSFFRSQPFAVIAACLRWRPTKIAYEKLINPLLVLTWILMTVRSRRRVVSSLVMKNYLSEFTLS